MNLYDDIVRNNQITIMAGSDYSDVTTIEQSAGVPMNLTGYTARSQLRDLNGGLVGEFVCTVTDPTAGEVTRTMSRSITATLASSPRVTYVWGLELTNGSVVLPEIQGGARIAPQVVQ